MAYRFAPLSLVIFYCFFLSAGIASAKEPFHFGIGMCEYSYSERTDSVMYAVKNAPSMPEDVYQQQDKYCSSDENIAKAEQELKKWKTLPEKEHPQHQVLAEGSNFNRGVDMFKACVAGLQLDTDSYFHILRKYKGKDILILGKAYDYGRLNARNQRDCTNYVMGR